MRHSTDSVHHDMNEQAAANIAWASDRAGRTVAEFYEEKLRGLQEQLEAAHAALREVREAITYVDIERMDRAVKSVLSNPAKERE